MDTHSKMPVTTTGIAVAVALVVVLGFFIVKPHLFTSSAADLNTGAATTSSLTMQDSNNSAQASSPSAAAPSALTIPANVTQLMTKDEVIGTGAEAKAGDSVTVQYVGMLTNGQVFDASKNHGDAGFTFKLGAGQVIKGWDEGVAGMKVGGKRQLIIPASLGYGPQAVGPIPANSTLVFEVELLKIQP